MRKLMTILGFEAYALMLAVYQWHIGVRTDEAKYLLNIPYPHPPLGRFIFSLFDGWAYQELFWRVVLATLVIQSVWLVLALVRHAQPSVRIAVAVSWLFSASVVLQAGTVMIAVVTALQALVLVWLFLRDRPVHPYLLALLWLLCLFTGYQAILFMPLVIALLYQNGIRMRSALVLAGVPVLLLALYTLTNPLVLASMVNQAGKDAAETILQRFVGTLRVWALGGSVALSIFGTVGLFLRPKAGLILSFLLVLLYVFVARYDYYAILFVPLFMAGVLPLLEKNRLSPVIPIFLMPLGFVLSLLFASYYTVGIPPRVYGAIGDRGVQGTVLINGNFGHEWQYATSSTVQRYHPLFLEEEVYAVICLQPCTDISHSAEWKRLEDVPVEVWVRS